MTIYDVSCAGNAADILRARGIKWDFVGYQVLECGTHYYSGKPIFKPGIHFYFMRNGCDVAYWTEIMNCLHINDAPRLWHRPWAEALRILPLANY